MLTDASLGENLRLLPTGEFIKQMSPRRYISIATCIYAAFALCFFSNHE